MITKTECMFALHGDMLEHTTNTNADGTPQRWRVNGRCKVWKSRPEDFRLPIKHGLRTYDYVTPSTRCMVDWQDTNPLDRLILVVGFAPPDLMVTDTHSDTNGMPLTHDPSKARIWYASDIQRDWLVDPHFYLHKHLPGISLAKDGHFVCIRNILANYAKL